METNIKDIKFGPEHVGLEVTNYVHGKAVILNVNPHGGEFAVTWTGGGGSGGTTDVHGKYKGARVLFIGHNVKITVEEEELPEGLICPVCGVEHEVCTTLEGRHSHFACPERCPFKKSYFNNNTAARSAMKNLINAMGGKS